MNKNFVNFIKTNFKKSKNINILLKVLFKRKIIVDDLLYVANTLNMPYSKLLSLYVGGKQVYTYSYIVQLIDNKEVEKLKEVILNNGIILRGDSVFINSYNVNEITLDNKYYQDLLRILIEANEVELARLISTSKCHLKHINSSISNIEEYLFDEKTGSTVSFLKDIYSSIDHSVLENLEPKLVKVYLNSINKLKSKDLIEVSNTPFVSIRNDGGKLMYEIDNLYKQFQQEHINLINNNIVKE